MSAVSAHVAQAGPWPLLSVSRLGVSFGPLRALDGVDLGVEAGECVAIAGENGAGKTTLVRCIAGDIQPSTGQILLAGRPVPADPIAVARQGVAVVWQDLALCDNLDIASNVLLGRERGRLFLSDVRSHAVAAALLSNLGIPLRDTTRSIGSLSGGQRQLVAVSRAMGHNPRLLLLDEPTASLGVRASALVEELIASLREQGTSILLACHDIDQMFRLADRIVVLRHGRLVADVNPRRAHPDDVVTLMSGQQVDSSARRQLTRLHGLVDRLSSADPSSSLSLILSALGAALGTERLCIHLRTGKALICAASLGLPPAAVAAWAKLPAGPAGGPVGLAAAAEHPVIEDDVRTSAAWAAFGDLARGAKVASSWSVPVMGPSGLVGVITVFRPVIGPPHRDELDLVTLYAGYAASAVERDQLLDVVTARNRVLETIREMLETLAGPVPVGQGLTVALQYLRHGLQAAEVALLSQPQGQPAVCRAYAGQGDLREDGLPSPLRRMAGRVFAAARCDGVARRVPGPGGRSVLAVTFAAPAGPAVLLARWDGRPIAEGARVLIEDAAHSLRLALQREEAGQAREEATALRRSQELQQGFLSRLGHELRTPLTAIRGYASSLMQSDVTWDGDSQNRFLARIAAESARLGRLVDDLLDFSAIESGILRMHPDWCDIRLVVEAAIACLSPSGAAMVAVSCDPGLPAVWADHDRLEQVFVNLLDNAIGHNPPGTRVHVSARGTGDAGVMITVLDDGVGMAPELLAAPFEPRRQRRTRTSGAGLGLSIAKAIVTAHGGSIELGRPARGTQLRIRLPVEVPARRADDGHALTAPGAGVAHPPVLAGGSGALAGWRQGAGADA